MNLMLKAIKERPILGGEFAHAQTVLLDGVNQGTMSLLARGMQSCSQTLSLEQARKRIVDIHEYTQTNVIRKYRCVTRESFEELHPGNQPAQDGHEVFMGTYMGVRQECVLVRKRNLGEWDVEDRRGRGRHDQGV